MSTLSQKWSQPGLAPLTTAPVTNTASVAHTPQRCDDRCPEQCITLQHGQVSSFEAREGEVVSCSSGAIWLTQSGDLTDYVLQDGEPFTARYNGKVVVQALSAAVVCVVRPSVRA